MEQQVVEELANKREQQCKECSLYTSKSMLGIDTGVMICNVDLLGEVVKDFHYAEANINLKKGDVMRGCGCIISLKKLSPDTQCPLGKWEDLK